MDRIHYCAFAHSRCTYHFYICWTNAFRRERELFHEAERRVELWLDRGSSPICQHCLGNGIAEYV